VRTSGGPRDGCTAQPDLIERLRNPPDAASWRRLVDLYSPLIRRWLRRAPHKTDEDDLVQEVLGAVVRAMPTFIHTGQTGSFRRWLRTTTAQQLSLFWRSRRSRPGEAPPDVWAQLEDPESDLGRTWDREHDKFVARRLLKLIEPEFSPVTWAAFRGQVLDGRPAAEVAAELGMTSNAARIAKYRVLDRLREEGRGLID
jgi:RNA polymerase sigma-70 factor (ECF subfamily)